MRKVYPLVLLALLCTITTFSQTTYYSKASATDFTSTASWGTNTDGSGAAPASVSNADNFIIANAAVMNLNAGSASVRQLTVTSGTLAISINTLTVSRATGNNSTLLINGGTLTVTGGAINLNGNFSMTSGNFNQSGGSIVIDGNDNNTAASSVASGTHLFAATGGTPNCSAGTITIVDPPVNTYSTGTTRSVSIGLSAGISYFTNAHTFILGDGVSTTPGNANGFVVETYASSRAPIQNLTVNGGSTTGRWGSGSYGTSTAWGCHLKGNLTINAGSEFRTTAGNASPETMVGGNLTNDGTLTTVNTLTIGVITAVTGFTVSSPSVITGTGVYRNATASPTASFTNLTLNNTNGVSIAASTLSLGSYGGNISGTLTLTSGTINTNGATLIVGVSTTTLGTFTYTAGGFSSGSGFGRWYAAATAGTTITAGSIPSSGAGSYPFIVGANSRNFHINRPATTGATGGVISVMHNDGSGLNTIAGITDGSYTVDRQTAANWTVSTSGGFAPGTGTFVYAVSGQGTYTALTSNVRLMKASSFVGTYQAGTSLPHAQRAAIAAADYAGTFYLGLSSAELPIVSAQTGKWEDASTWVGGVVPVCASYVSIASGHTVTIDATTATANSNGIIINAGGSLAVSGGILNIGCTNYNNSLTNNGTLTVSAGTVNINGNLAIANGSTFTQSGGNIIIDGNDNSGSTGNANSVASGTPLFGIGFGTAFSTGTVTLSGGTITIVDPHVGSATNTSAYAVYANMASGVFANATTAHTFQFGNGVSTGAGSHASGFYVAPFVGSGRLNFGNVIVNSATGTNRNVVQTGTSVINGDLTITLGTYDQGTSTTNIGGNISVATGSTLLAGGTFTFNTVTGTTASAQTTPQSVTVAGTGAINNLASATGNFTNISVNNTSSTGVTINALNNIASAPTNAAIVSGNITFTAGLVTTTGTNGLLWGTVTGGATGTLTVTAGGMAPGSVFGRFWTAGQTGSTITAATVPTTTTSRFPFLDASGNNRSMWITRVSPTAAGVTTVKYTDGTGTTPVSIVDATPAYTVDQQFNGKWTVGTAGTTPSATAFTLAISAPNAFSGTLSANYPRITTQSATVGTNQAGTILPHAQRTGVTLAQLTAQDLYIGVNAADIPFVSVASGNWENPATWNKNAVPTSADAVIIASGHNVTVNATAAVANALTVNTGGTLTLSGSTLAVTTTVINSGTINVSGGAMTVTTTLTNNASSTVNVSAGSLTVTSTFANTGTFTASGGTTNVTATSGAGITNAATTGIFTISGGLVNVGVTDNTACNRLFTNSGTFTISSGTFNIYGRLLVNTGSTFNQSGGDINVDGNAGGNAANSIAASTAIVAFNPTAASNINLTGGTLTIVDPHANSTASEVLNLSGSFNGSINVTTGHTIRFGNGTSTDAGGNATNGFRVNTWASTSGMVFGNMIVEGPAGTNRFVSGTYQQPVNGNLTVNNGGESRIATIFLNGNLVVNTGGIFTSTTSLLMSNSGFLDGSNLSVAASSNAQTISGTGVFQNLATAATANLTALSINNTNPGGVTINLPLSVSGTFTLVAGFLNTTTTNLLTLGTATASGTLVGGSPTAFIKGPMARTYGASRTATGAFSVGSTLFPVGTATAYLPIDVDPSTTASGAVVFRAQPFGSNSGTMGTGVTSLSINRWEALPTSGNANLSSVFIKLNDAAIVSTNKILQSTTAAGVYTGIPAASTFATGVLSTSNAIPQASYTGYLAYGDLTACASPTNQPTAFVTSAKTNTSITGSFTAAASNPSHYLVVRYDAGATPTAPTDFNTYTVGATLGSGGNLGTVVANVAAPATTFSATGLTANTAYDFYIYSYNNNGCSGPAYYVTAPLMGSETTCAAAVTAPSTLTATAVSSGGFTVNWTAPGSADLQLDIATDAAFTSYVAGYQAKSLSAGTTSEVVTGLNASTNYYVRLRAIDAGCYSAFSSTLTAKTDCAGEAVPTIVQAFGTYVPTCWKEATGALTASSVLTGTSSAWAAESGFANTGSNPAVRINLYSSSGTINEWLISQPIDLGAGGSFRIKYTMAVTSYLGTTSQSTLGTHSVKIVVSTDGGQTWSTANVVKTYTGAGTYSSTGQNEVVDLNGFSGVIRVGFLATAASTSPDIDFHVDNFLVEEIPTPVFGSFTPTAATCAGSTTLTINGTGLDNATVTVGGTPITLATNTSTQITANITADLTGTIEVTTSGGTVTSATPFNFTVAPALTLSGNAISVCSGSNSDPVTLTAGDADYNTFVWSPLSNVSGTAASGWTFNPTVSGTYTLTASQSAGLGCSRTATVQVNVKPAVTFSSATATPSTICANATSQLNASASIGALALITEVTQYRTGTGATTTYPAYIAGEDLVEITNLGSSALDISGKTIEVWSGTSLNRTFTIPGGTSIPASGVLVVHFGTGTDNAANLYFNAGGTTDGLFSSDALGIVLKNGSAVMDAVATNSYVWPVTSGVTAADWSGNIASSSGFAGVTRTAAIDNNTAANWTVPSVAAPQTMGTANAGVTGTTISYQWTPASFLDNANIANPVASGLPGTMGFSVKATDDQTGCFATTFVTVTVNPVSVGGTPSANQFICNGSSPSDITLTGNTGSVTKWQRSTDPGFGVASDINVAAATLPGATVGNLIQTTYFRAVVKSGVCSEANSSVMTVTVNPTTVAGSVSGAQTICIGNSPISDLVLSGETGTVVKWQKATDLAFTSPVDIASTSTTLTSAVIGAINQNTYFRAVVQSGVCPAANTAGILIGVNTNVTNATPLAGTSGGGSVCANYNVATSNNFLSNCELIATVVPGGASPVSGNINTCVKIDGAVQTAPDGVPYVQRHFDILPQANATTATSTITLYFTPGEFSTFNANNPGYLDLPVDNSDAAGKANLRVTQYNGTGSAPGAYTGTAVLINPVDADIVFDAAANKWKVTFAATGSGGFYVHTTNFILPVALLEFRGEQAGEVNKLSWKTATEKNSRGFELERSVDGKNFSKLAFITSKADNGNSTTVLSYGFDDVKPVAGNNYYRLKQIDKDGKISYSNTVILARKVADITLSSVYPNPATSDLNLVVTSPRSERVTIIVTDLSGKVLMQQATQLITGENKYRMDVMKLAAGTYFVKAVCASGCESAIHKFIKQ